MHNLAMYHQMKCFGQVKQIHGGKSLPEYLTVLIMLQEVNIFICNQGSLQKSLDDHNF